MILIESRQPAGRISLLYHPFEGICPHIKQVQIFSQECTVDKLFFERQEFLSIFPWEVFQIQGGISSERPKLEECVGTILLCKIKSLFGAKYSLFLWLSFPSISFTNMHTHLRTHREYSSCQQTNRRSAWKRCLAPFLGKGALCSPSGFLCAHLGWPFVFIPFEKRNKPSFFKVTHLIMQAELGCSCSGSLGTES